ncbi:MAG: aminopeptidase [Anaerolineales bacterium]
MADPRLKKLADLLVNYSVKVKPGDWVSINSSVVALPLLKEVYQKARSLPEGSSGRW